MNVNGNDNGVDDVGLTVSQGCYLLDEAHKCIMEALSLLSGPDKDSELALDRHTFRLAVHALRRGVLAVRVIELFPSGLFEELAHAEHEKAKRKVSAESLRYGACECGHVCNDDGDLSDSDSEGVKTSHVKRRTVSVVDGLRRHLVGITLMCYSVLLLYYIVHTRREESNFILALDYCNHILSFVPGTGTSLFDRELALLHARHLMENCRYDESEIDRTVSICLMLFEEERKRELRDVERMRYLQTVHAPCKNKVAFGG
uniref:14-3-3 protein n=1 Tax=Elaeophora elaphi TaxID=1147741 RepID=A0A0R3RFF6_9BILA